MIYHIWGENLNSTKESYESIAPWDISEPQPAIMWLEEKGEIGDTVLDIGCGTGQNALFLSEKGYNVTAIDLNPKMIEIGEERARKRNLKIDFQVYDLFELINYSKKFDTVIDSSVFHMFSDSKRKSLETNIRSILKDEGRYHMLVFSDKEPEGYGPRRIKKKDIRDTFYDGWEVYRIKEAKIGINIMKGWSWGWLASILKI